MLAIQLLGISSLFCILYADKKLAESFGISMKLSLLEQESHSLRLYVEEVKTRYEKTKAFRHDVKNHITVLGELLQNGKAEEARRYCNAMEHLTEDMSFSCHTNNPIVDILLGNKLGIARNEGIDASCTLHLPYPCAVAEIDFCILLANALDNAICACRKMEKDADKWIRVAGKVQGDFILLEIGNSFDGRTDFHYGTGIANIKSAAEKYHGVVDIEAQGGVFEVSILLNMAKTNG